MIPLCTSANTSSGSTRAAGWVQETASKKQEEDSMNQEPKDEVEGECFFEEDGVRIFIRDGSYCKPRRSLTAYNFFFQEERRKMIEKETERQKCRPKIGFASMARAVSSLWKQIDPDDRKMFEELAAKDKIRYTREMKLYKKLEKQLLKQQKKMKKEKEQTIQHQTSPTRASPMEEDRSTSHKPVPEAAMSSPHLNQIAKKSALKQLEESLHKSLRAHGSQPSFNLVCQTAPFGFHGNTGSTVPLFQPSNKPPVPLKEILEQAQDIASDMDDGLDLDPFELEAMAQENPVTESKENPLLILQPLPILPQQDTSSPSNLVHPHNGFMSNLASELGNECADLFIDMFRFNSS